MGELSFEPQHNLSDVINMSKLTLDKLVAANHTILSGQNSDILAETIVIGSYPQGARPKALVLYDETSDFITTNLASQNPLATPWLIKFPAQSEHKSVCLLEALYADMAKKQVLICLLITILILVATIPRLGLNALTVWTISAFIFIRWQVY